jgi:hypothetical protein
MTFHHHVGSINKRYRNNYGVNDMTKMIGKVDTKKISNMEWGTNEMDVFLSEDKLILIEMVVNKLKAMETGDSVIITYVNEPEDAIDLVCKMSS